MVGDSTGEALGALLQQISRRAAEHEKVRWPAGPVGEHPQDGKQIGPPLDLVEHDQTAQRLERQLRLGETGKVPRTLQIEERGRAGPLGMGAGQGALADLARSQQRDHRELAQEPRKLVEVARARQQHAGQVVP
jgi:hypothetical protein